MNQFNKVYTTKNNDTFTASLAPFKQSSTKAFGYRPVIIDGIESLSIEYHFGEPTEASIRRAEYAIFTYGQSNKAYYCVLDDAHHLQIGALFIDIINGMKNPIILAHESKGIKYLMLEGMSKNRYVKFAVFDTDMINAAIEVENKRHRNIARQVCFLNDFFGLEAAT